MQSVSSQFLLALRSGQRSPALRIDAMRDGTVLASDLKISTGSVTVDSTSSTRAQFSATFSDRSLESVFSQGGVELHVQAGVRFYSGSEMVPVGVFPIGSVKRSFAPGSGAGIAVSCPDRWATVARGRFLTPKQWSTAWGSLADAVGGLMVGPWQDRLTNNPGTVVPLFHNGLPNQGAAQPSLVWPSDRGKAITDLVTALTGEAFFDEVGDVVLRAKPQLATTAVWNADASATGVLTDASRARSFDQVYNIVVATGTGPSTTSTAAAYGQALINDSTHPLWTSGPFGSVPFYYSSPLLTTNAQAQAAAISILNTAASLNAQITATCLPNPALQCGDTISVLLPNGETEMHVLQGYTIPLTLDAFPQTLTLRSSKYALPAETTPL